MQDDEPLEQWAAKREKRLRPVGEKKIQALAGGHAVHVNPDELRLILSWDGVQWVPETIAENHAEACRLVYPPLVIEAVQLPERRKATGRHRKP